MIDFSSIITYSMALFIITNPIGNAPAIMALVQRYPISRQRKILGREWLFSLLIALFFQYFGEYFLEALQLQDYTIALCGGILLFMIAMALIFPHHTATAKTEGGQEPFLVPIATPLLSGPSLITIVMLYSRQEPLPLTLTISILAAWAIVGAVLAITPYLQRLLGERGITALEQLMGMILSLIAIQMVVDGISRFMETVKLAM